VDTVSTFLMDGIQWLLKALRQGVVSRPLVLAVVGVAVLAGCAIGWSRSGWLGLVVFALLGLLAGAIILYIFVKVRERKSKP
jgi:hypothetical protein